MKKILTLADVVDVLSIYEIRKMPFKIEGAMGLTYPDDKIIYTSNFGTPTQKIKTLLHELGHAYLFLTQLNHTESDANRIEKYTYQEYKDER